MPLAPITPSERIRGVDIARGLALLGILLVNVRFFFAPFASALRPMQVASMPEPDALDIAAWAGVEVFATFKFISLFSMLFGFGLALQAARAESIGRSRWTLGARRLSVLLALGLAHGLLVWYGDILTLYSVLGVGVLAALALPTRWLLRGFAIIAAGLVIASLGMAVLQSVAASQLGSVAPALTEAPVTERGWSAITASSFDIGGSRWIEAEIAAYREGPMADAFAFRAVSYAMALVAAPFGYGWHAFAMMLFGAWAFRTGLFASDATDPRASSRRRRLAATGIGLGLPVAAAAVVPWFIWGLGDPRSAAVHSVLLEVGALLLPLGYACAIVEFGPRLPGWIATALERTGRMAMTVYLCESLACVTLASWWGFGWFATMQDGRLTLVALAVWASLVLGATLWLSRFRIGPMEWAWRRLSYGRIPSELDAESRQRGAGL